MRDKVILNVTLPATGKAYEFRVSFDLLAGQAADLMASLLSSREGCRYVAPAAADLMYAQGSRAGELLEEGTSIRALVAAGELVDGQELALV